MDTQVTYIDEAEGGVVLKWDVTSQLFEGGADLSIGKHSGCLTLNTSDRVFPIAPFLVEHGGPSPQKIIISSGKKRVSNPHMGEFKARLYVATSLTELCGRATCSDGAGADE